MPELLDASHAGADGSVAGVSLWTVAEVHARYRNFVWKTLCRMGVRAPHLEDVQQEVFLVVHRRLPSFSGSCAITTWLFEICFRVSAGYRRRAHFRREELVPGDAAVSHVTAPTPTPEREVERRQAADRVQEMLARLNVDQRVVFTLFELESLSCDQISQLVGVPVGTVYSRLHRARKAFARALERERSRDARYGAVEAL
jgi:RNA polymerase sigma-70 factor, ECF subfamily